MEMKTQLRNIRLSRDIDLLTRREEITTLTYLKIDMYCF